MLCSLHVFMKLPSLVPDHIGTKACPGLHIRDRNLLSPNSSFSRRWESKEGMGGGTARINHRPSNATIQREQGSASSPSTADDRGEGDPRRARACLQPRAHGQPAPHDLPCAISRIPLAHSIIPAKAGIQGG